MMRPDLAARQAHLARAIVTSIAVLAAAGCGHARTAGRGWKAIDGRHFSLYAKNAEPVSAVLARLEMARVALRSSFFSDVDLPRMDVITIDEVEFEKAYGRIRCVGFSRTSGPGPLGRSGFFVVPSDGRPENCVEALAQAYAARAFPDAPRWAHEGLAGYLRTIDYVEAPAQRVACAGRPNLQPSSYLTFSQMFQLSAKEPRQVPELERRLITARVIVDYLMHGDGGIHLLRLPAFVDALRAGRGDEQLLSAAFPGIPLTKLEAAVVRHGGRGGLPMDDRGPCPIGFLIPAGDIPDRGPWRARPVDSETIAQFLSALEDMPRAREGPSWHVILDPHGGKR